MTQETSCEFHICPTCFRVARSTRSCHGRRMALVRAGQMSAHSRRPLMDERGNLRTRAPQWFLDLSHVRRLEKEMHATNPAGA